MRIRFLWFLAGWALFMLSATQGFSHPAAGDPHYHLHEPNVRHFRTQQLSFKLRDAASQHDLEQSLQVLKQIHATVRV